MYHSASGTSVVVVFLIGLSFSVIAKSETQDEKKLNQPAAPTATDQASSQDKKAMEQAKTDATKPDGQNADGKDQPGTDKDKKPQALDETQKKNLEKLIAEDQTLGPFLESIRRAMPQDFETLVREVPELMDFLNGASGFGRETVTNKLYDLLLKRLGVEAIPRNEPSNPTLANVEPAPSFGQNQQGPLRVLPEELIPAPRFQQPGGCAGGACAGNRGRIGNHAAGNGGGSMGSAGGGGSGIRLPRPQVASGRDNLSPPVPLSDAPFPRGVLARASRSGEPGKKAFEIVSDNGDGSFGHCQGTLVKDRENPGSVSSDPNAPCFIATAAHCVANNRGQRVVRYNTAYGSFTARAFFPRDDGTTNSDVAVLAVTPQFCRVLRSQQVPEVPLCQSPAQLGDIVTLETRYFNKTHTGQVQSELGNTLDVNVNFIDRNSGRHQGGIHTGDSGGPLLTNDSNSPEGVCLTGVLSASEQAATQHFIGGTATVGGRMGFYNTNLGFIRRILNPAFGTPRDSFAASSLQCHFQSC